MSAVVSTELERIRQRDGVLRASAVVEEAKPDDSPIHDKFTWDDDRAAHEYRLIEARHLIRAVVVNANGREVPAYAHVATGPGEGYYQAVTVLVEEEHRDEFVLALNGLRARLSSAAAAVRALEAVAINPHRQAAVRRAEAGLREAQEAVTSVA